MKFLQSALSLDKSPWSYHPINPDSEDISAHPALEQGRHILGLRRRIRYVSCICFVLLVTLLLLAARDLLYPVIWSRFTVQGLNIEGLLLAPEFPLVTKVYEGGNIIEEITPEIEQRWQSDMPRGRGFVRIPNGYDEDGDIYVVSVFHQLHCLYMMQKSFARAMEDASRIPIMEVHHTYHCAELLRQALKCAADPTLDTTSPNLNGRGTSGWNGTHVCRDYDRLFKWTEAHRSNDKNDLGVVNEHVGNHSHSSA